METAVASGTSTLTTRLVLSHVRDIAGQEAVLRVLEACELLDARALLESGRGRVPYAVKSRLFAAAAAELDEPTLGRQLGAGALTDSAAAPLLSMLRSLGSPEMVLRNVARVSTRFETSGVMHCEHAGPGIAVLTWEVLPPNDPSPIDCDYNIGLLEQCTVLFGLPPAEVHHPACQLRGDRRCRYLVKWRHRGRWRRWRTHAPEVAASDALTAQVQSLQEATIDLVGGLSITETLDRIAARAGAAVHAPGYALVVQLADGSTHVRQLGLPDSVGVRLVEDLRAGRDSDVIDGWPLIGADIASASQHYGRFVAVVRPGQAFFPEDEAMLGAYARHAAAALDTATALDRAREQGETARRLLEVARSLSARRTVDEVAHSLVEAIPLLTGADRASVGLWDEASQHLRIGAFAGWPAHQEAQVAKYLTTPSESPELAAAMTDREPLLLGARSSAWAQRLLTDFDITALVAMPIRVDDSFLGMIIASWATSAGPDRLTATMTERLEGLAGQAAVALDNARLLQQIRQQAVQDTTTGLGNRLLLQESLPDAITRARSDGSRVAVLFCDLDRFKQVNDTLGHAAGDELLQQVADRLTSIVRDGDVLVRFSGDEFVVVLADVTDPALAESIAQRIREAIRAPFALSDEEVRIEVSVGVAVSDVVTADDAAPLPTDEAARLIALADHRMYDIKHATRTDGHHAA